MQRSPASIRAQTRRSPRANGRLRLAAVPAPGIPQLPSRTAKIQFRPSGSIARPHLVRCLQQTRATLIALVAPAGYGKSTLLYEWSQSDPRAFVWLELSEREDDPAALSHLLDQTLDSLSDGGAETVLVLDRLDRLRSSEALSTLAELAHGLPSGLTLAVCSRSNPSLGLGRLRAADRLLQLGANDLAMSVEEAARVLRAAGVVLDKEALHIVAARTEGWPAALHLFALSLRANGHPQPLQAEALPAEALPTEALPAEALPAEALHAKTSYTMPMDLPTGDESTIAEYISEEVLAPLGQAAHALLMRTSVLDELSAEACDATLARQGTGQLLAELAAAGTVLVALDSAHCRFRCHPLVRDVLRCELALRNPEEIPRLHRRASDWFAEQGDRERAIEHACTARDPRRGGDLLWANAAELLYGRDEQVKRWLSAFSAEQIASSPALALAAAHSNVALANLPGARRWTRLAAQALSPDTESGQLRAATGLAEAMTCVGSVEQMAAEADRARRALRETDAMSALASMLAGVAAHLLGERTSARAELEQALTARSDGELPLIAALSLAQLALIDIEDDERVRAEDHAATAEATARPVGTRRASALTHATLALAKSRRGLADEAKDQLTHASRLLALPGELMPWLEVETRVVMARSHTRLAEVPPARALLSEASRLAHRYRPIPGLLVWIDCAWAEIDELGTAALGGPASLTMAELRVLRFLPTHLSFREIGERLHVSGNTVKTQAHAIYAKLDAASRTEAVAHASTLGLIDVAVI